MRDSFGRNGRPRKMTGRRSHERCSKFRAQPEPGPSCPEEVLVGRAVPAVFPGETRKAGTGELRAGARRTSIPRQSLGTRGMWRRLSSLRAFPSWYQAGWKACAAHKNGCRLYVTIFDKSPSPVVKIYDNFGGSIPQGGVPYTI